MKLIFTFSDKPNLSELSNIDIFDTHFQFPDEALQLPDCRERVLSIAQSMGQLTRSCLFLSCKELGLKHQEVVVNSVSTNLFHTLRHNIFVAAIGFSRREGRRDNSRLLKILNPIDSPIDYRILYVPYGKTKRKKTTNLARVLRPMNSQYAGTLHETVFTELHDEILYLLALEEPNDNLSSWRFLGVHPFWKDETLVNLRVKKQQRFSRDVKKQEREAAKQAKLEARIATDTKPKKGHIYFIQQGENGAIKIGYSTDPEKRLRTLRTASPYPLQMRLVIEGGKKLEKELHDKFADCQLDGEWFEATDVLLRFMEEQRQV
jgi:hypothetical protein